MWFSALILLMLSSAGVYMGRVAIYELSALSGETLYASAKSAADLLDLGLHEREKDIQLLSMAPYLRTEDLSRDTIRVLLELRKETYSEYIWLGVTDTSGVIMQATDGMLVGKNAHDRSWFKAAMAGAHASSVHATELLSPSKGEDQLLRFIDFSIPIFDNNNQVRGVLASYVRWDWVTDTVSSAVSADAKQRGIEILIANQSGDILYPPQYAGSIKLDLNWGEDRYKMMRWSDGKKYLVSQAGVQTQLNETDKWRIIVRQDADFALAPVGELLTRLLLLGLAAALFFILATYYAALRISRPIETLAEAARRIEKHDKEPEFPNGNKILEIKLLSDSVQAMTSSLFNSKRELQALNASLEKQVEERTKDLVAANRTLEELATTDGLTRINNRRSFDERLREHFLLMKRKKENFSLLIIDIDFFKRVNDVHGHQIGDHVLQQLAQILKDNTRASDFVARYGGEEFVILLSNTENEQEALALAEKIRQTVAATPFPTVGSLTISIGVSCSRKEDASDEIILKRADTALYVAKESGRNRVEFLNEDKQTGPQSP